MVNGKILFLGILRLYYVAGELTLDRMNKEKDVLNNLVSLW